MRETCFEPRGPLGDPCVDRPRLVREGAVKSLDPQLESPNHGRVERTGRLDQVSKSAGDAVTFSRVLSAASGSAAMCGAAKSRNVNYFPAVAGCQTSQQLGIDGI